MLALVRGAQRPAVGRKLGGFVFQTGLLRSFSFDNERFFNQRDGTQSRRQGNNYQPYGRDPASSSSSSSTKPSPFPQYQEKRHPARKSSTESIVSLCYSGQIAQVQMLISKQPELVNFVDANGKTPLVAACDAGLLSLAKMLLDYGANVDPYPNTLSPPLARAAKKGNIELCELLLERGANPSLADANGSTPLMAAVNSDSYECAQILLSKGSDVNAANSENDTALAQACYQGSNSMIELLLSYGADPNSINKKGLSPLHISIKASMFETARLLVGNGADLNRPTSNKTTPLMLACSRNSVNFADYLISNGASVHSANIEGLTALHYAAEAGPEVCQLLLGHGANPNAQDINGSFPLMIAARSKNVQVATVLINNRALIDLRDHLQQTALMIACIDSAPQQKRSPSFLRNDEQLAEFLIKAGAEINVVNNKGSSPLHLALKSNYKNTVSELVRRGADLTARDSFGNTPLMTAIISRPADRFDDRIQSIDLLLKHGSEVNSINHFYQTPLFMASASGQLDTCKSLLTNNADPFIHTSGYSPFISAVFNGKYAVAQLLLDHYPLLLNEHNCDSMTPLMLAVTKNQPLAVKFLIELGAPLDTQNKNKCTALHLATSRSLPNLVSLLLNAGADPFIQDSRGRSSFQIAQPSPTLSPLFPSPPS